MELSVYDFADRLPESELCTTYRDVTTHAVTVKVKVFEDVTPEYEVSEATTVTVWVPTVPAVEVQIDISPLDETLSWPAENVETPVAGTSLIEYVIPPQA